MCEYCGCQSVPAVELLTSEHEVVVNLLGEVQRALATGDLNAAAGGLLCSCSFAPARSAIMVCRSPSSPRTGTRTQPLTPPAAMPST